jgi:hypothetical protein
MPQNRTIRIVPPGKGEVEAALKAAATEKQLELQVVLLPPLSSHIAGLKPELAIGIVLAAAEKHTVAQRATAEVGGGSHQLIELAVGATPVGWWRGGRRVGLSHGHGQGLRSVYATA